MVNKQAMNIDFFVSLFKDRRQFIQLVRIKDVPEIAMDGSAYQYEAETLPELYDCLITVTQNENLQGGIQTGQVWLACFYNGDLNRGFLLRQLIDMKYPLHPKSKEGETVISSVPNKRINISNDPTAALTEPIPLGNELVTWLLKLTEQIKSLANDVESLNTWASTHTHPTAAIGPPSVPVVPPTVSTTEEKTAIERLERETETAKFLSDLAFIQEKSLKNSPPD